MIRKKQAPAPTRDAVVFLVCLGVLSLLCILLLSCPASGQTWQWSPPAPYQRAAVQVVCGRSAGSGTYVQYGKLVGVLTAKHVAYGSIATAKFQDGKKIMGTNHRHPSYDIAFLEVRHPSIQPLQFSSAIPKEGDTIEVLGFGGPKDILRPYIGHVKERSNSFDPYVIAGDSGAGILNKEHQIVGIVIQGQSGNVNRRWNTYKGITSPPYNEVSKFIGALNCGIFGRRRGCDPYGCDPYRGKGGDSQFYPPQGQGQGQGQGQDQGPLKTPMDRFTEQFNASLKSLSDQVKEIKAKIDSVEQKEASTPEVNIDDLVARVVAAIPPREENSDGITELQAQRLLATTETAIKRADQAKVNADEADRKVGDLEIRIQRIEQLLTSSSTSSGSPLPTAPRSGKMRFRLYFDERGRVSHAEPLALRGD